MNIEVNASEILKEAKNSITDKEMDRIIKKVLNLCSLIFRIVNFKIIPIVF